MELKGKKIAFLGDSITEGYGASCVEKAYWSLIGQQTGAQVFGYGIGGTTIARRQKPLDVPNPNKYFGSRAGAMVPDADVIVIFGGTNDFGGSDPAMGTMDDRTDSTFYGAYHNLINLLYCCYPKAKIVIMTPLHRLTEDDDTYNEQASRRGGRLSDYVEAIREIAGFYGLPVADMFRDCPIQPRCPGQQEKYMPDGVHPNDAGHELVAQTLLRTLKKL